MYPMAGGTEDKGKAHLLYDAEPMGLEFQMTVSCRLPYAAGAIFSQISRVRSTKPYCSLYWQIKVPCIGADVPITDSTIFEGGVWNARSDKGADRACKRMGSVVLPAGIH